MILKVQELIVEGKKNVFKGFRMIFHMPSLYVALAMLLLSISNSFLWVHAAPSPAQTVELEDTSWKPVTLFWGVLHIDKVILQLQTYEGEKTNPRRRWSGPGGTAQFQIKQLCSKAPSPEMSAKQNAIHMAPLHVFSRLFLQCRKVYFFFFLNDCFKYYERTCFLINTFLIVFYFK